MNEYEWPFLKKGETEYDSWHQILLMSLHLTFTIGQESLSGYNKFLDKNKEEILHGIKKFKEPKAKQIFKYLQNLSKPFIA